MDSNTNALLCNSYKTCDIVPCDDDAPCGVGQTCFPFGCVDDSLFRPVCANDCEFIVCDPEGDDCPAGSGCGGLGLCSLGPETFLCAG